MTALTAPQALALSCRSLAFDAERSERYYVKLSNKLEKNKKQRISCSLDPLYHIIIIYCNIYTVNVLTFMRDWLAKHEATRCVLRDILCVHPSVYWEDCWPQPGTKAKHLLQASRVEQKWTCDAFKLHTVIPCFTENAATTSGVFVSTWTRKVCHVSSGFNGKCLRVLATYAHDFLQEFSFRLAAWQGAATWLTNCDANKMWQNKE